MQSNLHIRHLAIFLALTASTSEAATKILLSNADLPRIQSQLEFNLDNKVRLHAEQGFQLLSEHSDLKGKHHIRMQQYYAGIPVFGGHAIMHSMQAAKTLSLTPAALEMNGKVYLDLKQDLAKMPLNYVKKAKEAHNQFFAKYSGERISEEKMEPVIYIDRDSKAHWAYQLSARIDYPDKIPEKPTAIVDAKNHTVYLQWNDIQTKWALVKGTGFGGNGKSGSREFGKDFPYLEITRDNSLEKCYMENIDTKVVDMKNKENVINRTMTFPCQQKTNGLDIYPTGKKGDGYERTNGAFSPANDALYAGYVIKNMFKEWYQTDVLKQANGTPMQLIMRVHYGVEYENAFWDGRQMTFGDGADFMYPLVSLGIGAHEIAHGFTQQNSNLVYVNQSGGMNESFSDMAAQAADYYATGTNNWLIGSEVMKYNEVIRFMEHPSMDQMSIESADQYDDVYDSHHSSGVYNRLFFLMANKPGWNTRKAFDVMVKANMDYWIPDETFEGGGCGILFAARDLGYGLEEIKSSLKEVAIHPEICKF